MSNWYENVIDLLLQMPQYLIQVAQNILHVLVYKITIGDVSIRVLDILLATLLAVWIAATIIKAVL